MAERRNDSREPRANREVEFLRGSDHFPLLTMGGRTLSPRGSRFCEDSHTDVNWLKPTRHAVVTRHGGSEALARTLTCGCWDTPYDAIKAGGKLPSDRPPGRPRLAAHRRLRPADRLPRRDVLCAVGVGSEKPAHPAGDAAADRMERAVATDVAVSDLRSGAWIHERRPHSRRGAAAADWLPAPAVVRRGHRHHSATGLSAGRRAVRLQPRISRVLARVPRLRSQAMRRRRLLGAA